MGETVDMKDNMFNKELRKLVRDNALMEQIVFKQFIHKSINICELRQSCGDCNCDGAPRESVLWFRAMIAAAPFVVHVLFVRAPKHSPH